MATLTLSGTTLYGGTPAGVFRSKDEGGSWTPVNTGLVYPAVIRLAASSTTLYAGTLGGGVFQSENRSDMWQNAGLTDVDVMLYVGALNASYQISRWWRDMDSRQNRSENTRRQLIGC